MNAVLVVRNRVVDSPRSFAEFVLWRLPEPLTGSTHRFKYRLAYVVDRLCVVRYDNEAGKGDHRHFAGRESPYTFTTPSNLMTAFQRDIERWNLEHGDPRSHIDR